MFIRLHPEEPLFVQWNKFLGGGGSTVGTSRSIFLAKRSLITKNDEDREQGRPRRAGSKGDARRHSSPLEKTTRWRTGHTSARQVEYH